MVDTNSYQNLDADTPFLDPNQKKNVHTRRNIIVAVLIVAVVVAVAAVLLMKDDDSKEPWEKENPYGPVWTGDRDARFGTPDSLNKEQSSVMKSLMDTKVDPCNDFYRYACGNFISKTSVTSTESNVYSFSGIGRRVEKEIATALKEKFSESAGFYREACSDTSSIDKQGVAMLKPHFDLIDTITDLDSFMTVLGQLHQNGIARSAFLQWFVTGDFNTGIKNVLYLGIFGHSVSQRLIIEDSATAVTKAGGKNFNDDSADRVSEIEEVLDNSRLVQYPISVATLINAVPIQVADMEKETGLPLSKYFAAFKDTTNVTEIFCMGNCGGSGWSNTLYAGIVNRVKSDEITIQGLIDYLKWHTVYSELKFLPSYFRNLAAKYDSLGQPSQPIRINDLHIAARSSSGARAADDYFGSNEKLFMNMVKGRELKRAAVDNPFLKRKVEKLEAALDGRTWAISSAAALSTRNEFCNSYTLNLFHVKLSEQWIKDYFPAENKVLAKKLVEDIIGAMGVRLNETVWLDETTRAGAVRKLNAIVKNVAYYDHWPTDLPEPLPKGASSFEYSTNTWKWRFNRSMKKYGLNVIRDVFIPDATLFDQNAFYSPTSNSINMLAGLMYQPFFSVDQHMLLNIAAYGLVIGHEITHGFDNSGRLWGPYGGYENWWTEPSTAEFNKRAQCIIDAYDLFEWDGSGYVNGEQTLGENIADAGGLNLAWQTYKKYAFDTKVLGDFPNDETFFISFAQSWCQKTGSAYRSYLLANDVHAPGPFRIRGSLQSFKPFAETFKCTAEDKYGISLTNKKCEVW